MYLRQRRQITNSMTDIDQKVRIAAFNWLDEQVSIHGDVLPRSISAQGFKHEGLIGDIVDYVD